MSPSTRVRIQAVHNTMLCQHNVAKQRQSSTFFILNRTHHKTTRHLRWTIILYMQAGLALKLCIPPFTGSSCQHGSVNYRHDMTQGLSSTASDTICTCFQSSVADRHLCGILQHMASVSFGQRALAPNLFNHSLPSSCGRCSCEHCSIEDLGRFFWYCHFLLDICQNKGPMEGPMEELVREYS